MKKQTNTENEKCQEHYIPVVFHRHTPRVPGYEEAAINCFQRGTAFCIDLLQPGGYIIHVHVYPCPSGSYTEVELAKLACLD